MADNVFYPNACHVCRKYGKNIKLKKCNKCRMIFYCGEEHQKKHWPQHRRICEAIKEMLNGKKYLNTEEICWEHWDRIKTKSMMTVSTKLQHCLKKYEKQMFWFSRACVICFRQNKLINCSNCPCASFCNKHKDMSEHANHCKTLKLCFEVETVELMGLIDIRKIILPNPFDDMTSFINNYVLSNQEHSSNVLKLLYSEYLTRPLTLLFAIKRLNLRLIDGNLVVHIIASHIYDDVNFNHWEVLFHEMPLLMSLTIIGIGPNVRSTNHEIGNFCDDCIKMKKTIVYEHYPMFYRAYVRTEDFIKPDVIVAFNAIPHEFYDKNYSTTKLSEEHIASAQALMEQNCPYILTLLMLPDTLKARINIANCIFIGKNPFTSVRPHRSTFFEESYYRNRYLIIYENIKNSLILIDED